MEQAKTGWPALANRTAVVAAAGFCGTWSERIARAFIIAAAKAGVDAVECPAGRHMVQQASFAAEHGLHTVIHVASADDARAAIDAGLQAIHADLACADDSLANALRSADLLLLSNPSAQPDILNSLRESCPRILALYSPLDMVRRLQRSMAGQPDNSADCQPFGFEAAAGLPIPAAITGVMAAASGASVVRQFMALARYFGREDAAHFLSMKDFRELVQNLRAAERIAMKLPEQTQRSAAQGRTRTRPVAGRPARDRLSPRDTAQAGIVIASEIIAKVAAIIDLSAFAPDAAGFELQLARLRSARSIDCIVALAGEASAPLLEKLQVEKLQPEKLQVETHPARENWLGGMLACANRYSADVIVWLPAENVLIDHALLDRMIIQHVKSEADCTLCSDLPAGLAARLVSTAALRRIATFTGGSADAQTVAQLLANRRAFRVQEMIVESNLRRPELDLTWRPLVQGIVQTGTESAAELIERFSQLAPPSESIAREPYCTFSVVTHGDSTTSTV